MIYLRRATIKNALIQKRSEIKLKQNIFFNWSDFNGAILKLKTNRNCSVYEMGCPLRNPSLFTLKLYSLPQFYFLKQLKL